jgi:addiction module HigA family antidote
MVMTKRKPASVGEILTDEFMTPMRLTQGALAAAMGVPRKHVNELCNNRRSMTAPTALILARVFGNSPEFWLNIQRRIDLWEAMHSPRERERIMRARRLTAAARPDANNRTLAGGPARVHRPVDRGGGGGQCAARVAGSARGSGGGAPGGVEVARIASA